MTLYTKNVKDQTDNFADALFEKMLRASMTLECLQLTPFCFEKFSLRKELF